MSLGDDNVGVSEEEVAVMEGGRRGLAEVAAG